ncbi:MAG: hypothetical protein GF364_11470, partial [Candidatus Lokiarchaeota archaeon]|nr:hypothetical protein [Candidatus Lokiarchaeota archaeon]
VKSRKGRDIVGYSISEQGLQLLNTLVVSEEHENWLIPLFKRNEALENLRTKHLIKQKIYEEKKTLLGELEDALFGLLNNTLNILEFGGSGIGDINEIVGQIGTFSSKLGKDFFRIPQTLTLHLALIYIFFNSLENPQFHMNETDFIAVFGKVNQDFRRLSRELDDFKSKLVKSEDDLILFRELELLYLRKSHESDMQLYSEAQFKHSLNELRRIIVNKINEEKINVKASPEEFTDNYLENFQKYVDLRDKLLQDLDRNLNLVLNSNLGVYRFYYKSEPYFFHKSDNVGSYLNRKINDMLLAQLINKKLFGLSEMNPLPQIARDIAEEMVIKHIITEEIKHKFLDVILEIIYTKASQMGLKDIVLKFDLKSIKGFCPSCGERILTNIDECEFCREKISMEDLILNIKDAKRVSAEFKAEKYVESPINSGIFTNCPSCGKLVAKSWTICPQCNHKL